MTNKPSDPKSFEQMLHHQSAELNNIYAKIQQLQRLQEQWELFLPLNLQPYCRVANFRDGCLIIAVASAAWATQLRYVLPDMLQSLRSQGGLYQLCSISHYIEPDLMKQNSVKPAVTKKVQRPKLSSDTVALLR
jgi:hypothetical protein